jgi:formate--tetrahydrofolate ligase
MSEMRTDWDIANSVTPRPIVALAADRLGIPADAIEPYGHFKGKIGLPFVDRCFAERPDGKLIVVTAINPTPAGEGKTTTTVGLGDALNRIGKKAILCLREPSLGPCFGVKGGAAGGGLSQVIPMDEINLHFTGDLHAVAAANNLLAAMVDNHIYWASEPVLDPRRVTWRRCLDMNDRALREVVSSLGGVANGFPRQDGFDITVASEIMAILCLSTSIADLERRLNNVIVGATRDRKPVTAADLKAAGAMVALLKDALKPNLVQTLEANPAFIHGGPFANIAHGCNTVMATKLALKLADYVVTEAGFGADLGAEKFFDIKCRKSGLKPEMAVIVASVRALKFHGGVARADLGKENPEAVAKGMANLHRHLANIKRFGVPAVVGVNRFGTDTAAEHAVVVDGCKAAGVTAIVCTHWAEGSKGAEALAHAVVDGIAKGSGGKDFKLLYPDDMKLLDKVRTIATTIYGAAEVTAPKPVLDRFEELEKQGFGKLPVCMAKTQYSFSADPELRGAPSGFALPVREVRLSAGAEFVVAICGDVMTMPGLPRVPSAVGVSVDREGHIIGLS